MIARGAHVGERQETCDERADRLGQTDRLVYVGCVVLGAAATGTLSAPVCLHRLVTGLGVKPEAVVRPSRLTSTGLMLFLGTIALALLVVLRTVVSPPAALIIDAALLIWFAICWLIPALVLRRAVSSRPQILCGGAELTVSAGRRATPVRPIRAESWPKTCNS
ncbi:hypothetical protein KV205_06150 [Streptomyces sp. SKN60]|uniref:DUF6328 family protein n=1 Tax=Streptomyces sp. SKN60 TaxID=2855506 RepID=UPI0022483563|nr:DUF6328 family protein [Streptomyces sp. SKN60]MCX2180112.1 hypothetical protein [Streptomyces sp. SKN60]